MGDIKITGVSGSNVVPAQNYEINTKQEAQTENIMSKQTQTPNESCSNLQGSQEAVNELVSNYEASEKSSEKTNENKGFFKSVGSFFKNIADSIAQSAVEFVIGKNYSTFYGAAETFIGRDAAGMLDLAHKKTSNSEFLNNVATVENYDDPAVSDLKGYLETKVSEQFKDYNVDPKNVKGYIFGEDSILSQDICKDENFQNAIKNNLQTIDNGKDFCMSFYNDTGSSKSSDLSHALGMADIKSPKFDKEGNLTLKVCDTYDFNKSADDILNKAGANQMAKGNLTPYFSVINVKVPKETIDALRES